MAPTGLTDKCQVVLIYMYRVMRIGPTGLTRDCQLSSHEVKLSVSALRRVMHLVLT